MVPSAWSWYHMNRALWSLGNSTRLHLGRAADSDLVIQKARSMAAIFAKTSQTASVVIQGTNPPCRWIAMRFCAMFPPSMLVSTGRGWTLGSWLLNVNWSGVPLFTTTTPRDASAV